MGMDEKYKTVKSVDVSKCSNTVKVIQENSQNIQISLKKMQENLTPALNQLTGTITTIKAMAQAYSDMVVNFSTYIQSEAFQNTISSLNNTINKLIKLTLSEDSLKTFRRIRALELLREVNWPFFLYLNDEIIESLNLIDQNSDKNTLKDIISNIIFEYVNTSFLKSINEYWNDCEWLNDSQKALLRQAIMYYDSSFYDATVAILMCQVDGIIDEFIKIMDHNEINYDEADFLAYLSYFSQTLPNDSHMNAKNIKRTEKQKLFIMGSSVENAELFWFICIEYIATTVLTSKNDFPIDQPCRNKICHGVQTDINSMEIAIKSILAVDIIITLGNDLIQSKNINKVDG